jgi:hypothetical protein
MSKKAYFVSIGCFILGLVLGIVGTSIVIGKIAAEAIVLMKAGELAASGEQADNAYQHESRAVAIYASSQYLITLKEDEELVADMPEHSKAPINKLDVRFGMIMAHGRLAQLYDEAGQTNLGAQHLAEALKYAKESGKFPAVTNQTMLAKFITKIGTRKETP